MGDEEAGKCRSDANVVEIGVVVETGVGDAAKVAVVGQR